MNPHRISVKYFLEDPKGPDQALAIPVFHSWIQSAKVPGLLIDVADYRHMVDGPGVMLIGHDVDYAIDTAGGQAGMLHVRKRDRQTDIDTKLAKAFYAVISACRHLEQEQTLGSPQFKTDQAVVSFLDHLQTPNDQQMLEKVSGSVQAFASRLYDQNTVELEHVSQRPVDPLAIRISASDAPPLDTLLERLSAAVA